MKPLLELFKVTAGYGEARILNDLTLSVGQGERVALVGRNGVGKTTLVNTLLAGARLMFGTVQLHGRPVARLAGHTAAQNGIAVVPQGRRVLSSLSVEENLRLGAVLGRPGPWDLEKVYGLFPILRERRKNSGTALSGGQQQMVAIGRALMANPDLLILDEPCEGLAPVIVDEMTEIFKGLAGTGVAILLIEQHLELVQQITERFYVMSKGKVTQAGRVAEVSRQTLQDFIMQ